MNTKFSRSLDTGDQVLVVSVRWWVRCEPISLCIFRTCGFPSYLSSLFVPCMKGALRVGWVKAHVLWCPCLGWVSWSSSQHHTSPRMLCCMRAVHVQLPLETSMAADSRNCEGATGFLYTCSRSPTDLVFWDWPDLGQRLRATGPGVTAPLRTTTSSRPKLQVVLITIFAHSSTRWFTFHFF